MKAQSEWLNLGARDWSRLDTGRWSLAGLGLEGVAGTLADLLERVRTSPGWAQALAATLQQGEGGVRDHVQRRTEAIEAEIADLDRTLAERVAGVERRKEALAERARRAAAPPRLAADPGGFALGLRVAADRTTLGVPGLTVRLLDPRERGAVLAATVTDADGKAVLLVPREAAEELAKARVEATVEVLGPKGQVLQRAERAVAPRANRVETWVGAVKRSPELEPHLALAAGAERERQARLSALASQADRLRAAATARREELQAERAEALELLGTVGASPGATDRMPSPPASPVPSPPSSGSAPGAGVRPPMPRVRAPRGRPRGPA